MPLFLAVAFLAGLRMRAVFGLAAVILLTAALAWPFLKDYQKTRIYTFLDPSLDPRGAGYQKIQSQIAVGSGGLLGRGFLEGSQAQLGYLPARHTDFIFSVLAEEAGFVGVVVALALYLLVLWRMLETARLARDRLGAFLVAGVARELRVPGRVQCRHGRGARSRQGAPAPPHELRRLLDPLVAHGNRPRPQRPDAALRELTLPRSPAVPTRRAARRRPRY